MGKNEELDKLDKAIKDAEISLKSIQSKMEVVDKEISALTPYKRDLEQNIQFHKKADSVPIAQEYKKSKAELVKVKTRLAMITSDQIKAIAACNDIEKIIERYKKSKAELLKVNENNVLNLFGGKRGKK